MAKIPATLKGMPAPPKIMDLKTLKAFYVQWMSDPRNRRDSTALKRFCVIYNAKPEEVRKFEIDRELQADIRKNVREYYGGGERIRELYETLHRRAVEGNVGALKFAMELIGEYTPKLKVEDDTKTLEDLLGEMDLAEKSGRPAPIKAGTPQETALKALREMKDGRTLN